MFEIIQDGNRRNLLEERLHVCYMLLKFPRNKAMFAQILISDLSSELGDDPDVPGPTTLALRLKHLGQAEELVSKFSGVSI